jgi:hypothetical protein
LIGEIFKEILEISLKMSKQLAELEISNKKLGVENCFKNTGSLHRDLKKSRRFQIIPGASMKKARNTLQIQNPQIKSPYN